MLFWLIVSLPTAIFAVDLPADIFQRPLGPETAGSFREVCRQLSGRPVIRGKFEQEKILSSLKRSLVSTGNFIIAEGLGTAWETQKPFPSTLAAGRDFLIQSRPGGQKTRLDARGNETFLSLAEIISSLFSGNENLLLENFQVFFAAQGGKWEMGLIPLDGAVRAFASHITMDGDDAIQTIFIREQNGDSIRYRLWDHSYPEALREDEKALFRAP